MNGSSVGTPRRTSPPDRPTRATRLPPERCAVVLALALAAWASPTPVAGQVLSGRLLTAFEDRPIAGGTVRFLSEDGDTLATAASDAEGRFVLAAPAAGSYLVHAEDDFHDPLTEGPIALQAGDTLQAELRLMPRAFEMDGLDVEVERRSLPLDRAGFYDRAVTGLGRFITEEDIARRNPLYTSDVLSALPGVLVQSGGLGPPQVYVRRRGSLQGSGWCRPRIYVDHVLQTDSPYDSPLNDIRPELIAGIEVYTSQLRVPPAYAGGATGCGVILIWTKG